MARHDAQAKYGVPFSNGCQIEVINRSFETYLRCFVGDKPREWEQMAVVGCVLVQHGILRGGQNHFIPSGIRAGPKTTPPIRHGFNESEVS